MAEVRKTTGLTAATLRYWEEQFSELHPRKDGHGNRYYTQTDINWILRIKYIRDELKITRIDAIRRELKSNDKQSDVKQRAADILHRVRAELVEIRNLI